MNKQIAFDKNHTKHFVERKSSIHHYSQLEEYESNWHLPTMFELVECWVRAIVTVNADLLNFVQKQPTSDNTNTGFVMMRFKHE